MKVHIKNKIQQVAQISLIAFLSAAILCARAVALGPGQQTTATGVVGNWQGTLKASGAELRLVLHVSEGDGGQLKGTLDSIDQPGANGIPVTSISLEESKLIFTVDAVHGSYDGKLSADGTTVEGTWTQGQPLPLTFKRAPLRSKAGHKSAKPSDIDGAWLGALDAGSAKIRIVFHITNTEDGLTATMDSPDQGAKGIPVTTVTRNGASLVIELKQIGGKFDGKISADLSTIDGTWTQGGSSLPLQLKHSTVVSFEERKRPQNPSGLSR
jgi:uncharacterized protein